MFVIVCERYYDFTNICLTFACVFALWNWYSHDSKTNFTDSTNDKSFSHFSFYCMNVYCCQNEREKYDTQ